MRRLLTACIPVTLMVALGCAANPITAWQASLEEYVAKEGNGDLNVLRRTEGNPAESDFGLIGARRAGFPFFAPRRTDASGVLMGYRFVDDRGWYLYLLGLVEYRGNYVDWPLEDPRVTDIRLVACSGAGGSINWLLGEPDKAALQQYCRPQVQRWRESHPDRETADTAPTVFPTPADRMQLTAENRMIRVRDEHSQAEWVLILERTAKSDQRLAAKSDTP